MRIGKLSPRGAAPMLLATIITGCGDVDYHYRSYQGDVLGGPRPADDAYVVLTPTRTTDSGLFSSKENIGAPFTLELIVRTSKQPSRPAKIESATMRRDDGEAVSVHRSSDPALSAALTPAPGGKGWKGKVSIPLRDQLAYAKGASVTFTVRASVPFRKDAITLAREFRAKAEDGSGKRLDFVMSQ